MLGREKWKWGQEAIVSWWRITAATKPIRLWPITVNCTCHIFEEKRIVSTEEKTFISLRKKELCQQKRYWSEDKTHPVTSPDLNDNTSESILPSLMNKSLVSPTYSWPLFQNWTRIEANSKGFCPSPKMSNNMYTFMCHFQRMNISWRCSNLKQAQKLVQVDALDLSL